MATTPRAAAKKPATKKPTTPRRREPKPQPVVVEEPTPTPTLSENQKQAKLEAYHALKSVGLDIPQELAEVEQWVADLNAQREIEAAQYAAQAAAQQAQIDKVNQAGPWYVRNGYPAPFNLRLDRQTESRRIELKPRGKPGDLHPLKDEDLKDPVLKQNLSLGLIEIIPAGEAAIIIEKQTTNMGHRVHTPLAILRNEKGDMYAQGAVKVEAEFNSQGVTVAHIDPRVAQGQASDRDIKNTGGLTRAQPGQASQASGGHQGPQQASTVVHSGFVPTNGNQAIIQYGPHGANAQAKVVDDLARRKNLQGPAAGLGDITVTVDPVVRT